LQGRCQEFESPRLHNIELTDFALTAKLADTADNTDPARLSRIAEPRQTLLRAKYSKAFVALGRDDLAQAL
jgi:hypothetical protein